MKTKIVYTIVSGNNDIYMAQAVVSAYTARVHNPEAQIYFVVDNNTRTIVANYPAITKYKVTVIAVNIPDGMTQIQRSRYLKTNLRNYIKGNFLFIDTDTVIASDLSEIDDIKADIAAVLDRHVAIDDNSFKRKVQRDISYVGLTAEDICGKYYNSGVVFCKDTEVCNKFYEVWHKEWNECREKGHNIDQPSFVKANKDLGFVIEELPGIWNCQMVENFVNFLPSAKILHYFASNKQSPYQLYDNSILSDVKDLGDVPFSLKKQLDKPKEFFRHKHFLIYGDNIDFYHSYVYTIFTYHKFLFRIFDYLSKCVVNKKMW